MRDWNDDGKVDGRDYALFYNVIDDDDSDNLSTQSVGCSGIFWVAVMLLVVWGLFKLFGG